MRRALSGRARLVAGHMLRRRRPGQTRSSCFRPRLVSLLAALRTPAGTAHRMTAPAGTIATDDNVAQPLGNGVFLIDTYYVRPGLAASHLVVDDGHAAFVDTGAAPAAPRLLQALDELG